MTRPFSTVSSDEEHSRHAAHLGEDTLAMQKELHLKTTVLPGGRIEIVDQELPVGESVDVIVRHAPELPRRSAVDILAEAPGQRVFKTAEEVESYVKEERESWDR